MSQSDRSKNRYDNVPHPGQMAPEQLCSLVYRSRAVTALSDYDLYELIQAAQARNAREAITGLMLYDDGRFYQWLEGPPQNVTRLMNTIATDRRHTDIEILSDKTTTTRQFGDWKMRLATRGARSIHSLHNVVVPTMLELDDIRSHPDHATDVLAGFATGHADEPEPETAPTNSPLKGPAGSILKDIIITAVLPELISRHIETDQDAAWPIDQRARALADLLVGTDTSAALELLRTLQGSDGAIRHLYESLVEPAARRLGDLWGADLCSELDVTLGLSQLQRAIRVLNEEVLQPTMPQGLFLPAVLIVPEPGEVHMLNSVLDSDVLGHAGWDPLMEFPASDEALQDLMAGSWFDALDISVSPSFRRDSWLPKITKTIALARHASRNPALVVVVGGRIFTEDKDAGTKVGADGVNTTTRNTERTIQNSLSKRLRH